MTITMAVTGGIGSGKSTVSARLVEHGAILADSDAMAREVVGVGTPGLAGVVAEFGMKVLADDGSLNRAALASIVFAEPAARRRLEAITHPLVRARFGEILRSAPLNALVVNDIPLLVGVPAAAAFGLVLGVHAPDEIRVQRLVRRGLTETDARARITAQISDDVRAPLCDIWLSNEGSPDELRLLVDGLWNGRLEEYLTNVRLGLVASRHGPRLVDPDPAWPTVAALLMARISHLVGGARVDHIGSTAIPGLPAKDVIDLQLTVADLDQADRWRSRLAAGGFPAFPGAWVDNPHPASADPAGWQKRLHGNADPGRAVNLHLRVRASPAWRWAQLFPAWLRADGGVRQEYLVVKRDVAAAHTTDATSAAYAEAKEPWMALAYPRGLAWAQATGWQPAAD